MVSRLRAKVNEGEANPARVESNPQQEVLLVLKAIYDELRQIHRVLAHPEGTVVREQADIVLQEKALRARYEVGKQEHAALVKGADDDE